MTAIDLFAILMATTALLAYLNHKVLRWPLTIGVMALAMGAATIILIVGQFVPGLPAAAEKLVESFDFNETLMQGMLCHLLFAGALHVDLGLLAKWKWPVLTLATFGVMVSTGLIGAMTYGLSLLLGLDIPFIFCLLFGALISPTDPVAVLSVLKTTNIDPALKTKIAGESLFNDGVGIVAFLVILGFAVGSKDASAMGAVKLFVVEVGGGVIIGAVLGWLLYTLMRRVDDYHVEIILSLGLVAGAYSLASHLHVSGPLAVVIAGLFIGNTGKALAMSKKTAERLDQFWEMVDEILNAMLFVLLGLELLVLEFHPMYILAGVLLIPTVLVARFIAIGVPIKALDRFQDFAKGTVPLLAWGGVRGGISVALALQLPPSTYRDAILVATYCVVAFSILVQGLTIKRVVAMTSANQ